MKKRVNKSTKRTQEQIAQKRYERMQKQREYLTQFPLQYRRVIVELLLQSDFDVKCIITGDIVNLSRRFNYTVDHLKYLLNNMQELNYITLQVNDDHYAIVLNHVIENDYFSIK